MDTPKITAYLKTTCGWSAGVRAVLAKYNLPYTEKDIIQNPAFRWEMETKSGQPLSPCIEINDKMLADISGDEVEEYLIENKLVQTNAADAGAPTNAPCALARLFEPAATALLRPVAWLPPDVKPIHEPEPLPDPSLGVNAAAVDTLIVAVVVAGAK